MSLCAFSGSPPLHNAIAGIGVRLSIYIQAFLTITFTTFPTSHHDINNLAFNLTATRIFIIHAALALSCGSDPQITLQDAVIAMCITCFPRSFGRIATVILPNLRNTFDMDPRYGSTTNGILNLIMDALSAWFATMLFVDHEKFGNHPECQDRTKVFVFKTFTVSHAWFAILFILHIIIISVVWTEEVLFYMAKLYVRRAMEKKEIIYKEVKLSTAETAGQRPFGIAIGILTYAALALGVVFTELTVRANDFAPSNTTAWYREQIIPMLFLALSLRKAAKVVFKRYRGNGGGPRGGTEENEKWNPLEVNDAGGRGCHGSDKGGNSMLVWA